MSPRAPEQSLATAGAWTTLSSRLRALAFRARYPLYGAPRRSLACAAALTQSDRTLSGDEPEAPGDAQLFDREARSSELFLGVYSRAGLRRTLVAHGLFAALEARGFRAPEIELDLRDASAQRVRLYDRDPARVLGELVASRRAVTELGPLRFRRPRDIVRIEWLTLANPDDGVDADPALMPGQRRRGLGLVREVIVMGLAGCKQLGWAGMLVVPSHYHLAWIYHPWFRPLDPEHEARLLALRDATSALDRTTASWAIERGELHEQHTPWRWQGIPMFAPVAAGPRRWLRSWAYARAVVDARARLAFTHPPSTPPDQSQP